MKEKELAGLLLPEGILQYFQISDLVKKDNEYIIFLEELNMHPEQYKGHKLKKGFMSQSKFKIFLFEVKPVFF
jgi:hypothetical protein